MDLRAEKAKLQEAIRQRLAAVPENDRAVESRGVCKNLIKLLPTTGVVAGFIPIHNEVDIRPILQECLHRHLDLFLPRMEGKLVFRRVTDLTSLKIGSLNIPEPPADAELLDLSALTLAIIPGRAFDREGNRMGRGNGGYDIWLRSLRATNPNARVVGVALECQLVSSIPMETHDERVDMVVTARGVAGKN